MYVCTYLSLANERNKELCAMAATLTAAELAGRILCLSRHSGWRYKHTLSRHLEWRDQRDLPRHQVKNAVLTGLGHTMAQPKGSVAPTPLARQTYFVAPLYALAQ